MYVYRRESAHHVCDVWERMCVYSCEYECVRDRVAGWSWRGRPWGQDGGDDVGEGWCEWSGGDPRTPSLVSPKDSRGVRSGRLRESLDDRL